MLCRITNNSQEKMVKRQCPTLPPKNHRKHSRRVPEKLDPELKCVIFKQSGITSVCVYFRSLSALSSRSRGNRGCRKGRFRWRQIEIGKSPSAFYSYYFLFCFKLKFFLHLNFLNPKCSSLLHSNV